MQTCEDAMEREPGRSARPLQNLGAYCPEGTWEPLKDCVQASDLIGCSSWSRLCKLRGKWALENGEWPVGRLWVIWIHMSASAPKSVSVFWRERTPKRPSSSALGQWFILFAEGWLISAHAANKSQDSNLAFLGFFCPTAVWTQGLALARQELYHLSLSTRPFWIDYFWNTGSGDREPAKQVPRPEYKPQYRPPAPYFFLK
jgi:hypothetical protein